MVDKNALDKFIKKTNLKIEKNKLIEFLYNLKPVKDEFEIRRAIEKEFSIEITIGQAEDLIMFSQVGDEKMEKWLSKLLGWDKMDGSYVNFIYSKSFDESVKRFAPNIKTEDMLRVINSLPINSREIEYREIIEKELKIKLGEVEFYDLLKNLPSN